jgi:hypothetical protein
MHDELGLHIILPSISQDSTLEILMLDVKAVRRAYPPDLYHLCWAKAL